MKIYRQFSIKDYFLTMYSYIEDEFGDLPEPVCFQCCIDPDFIRVSLGVKEDLKDEPVKYIPPSLVNVGFTTVSLDILYHEMKYFMDIALLFVSPTNQNDYVSQTLPAEP